MAKAKRVAVMGLGRLGLPAATAFAASGLDVVGVDDDEALVARVNRGEDPTEADGPGLDELLSRVVGNGSLRATDDLSAVADSDHIIVAVDTSFDRDDHWPDIRDLKARARSVGRHLGKARWWARGACCRPSSTCSSCRGSGLRRSGGAGRWWSGSPRARNGRR